MKTKMKVSRLGVSPKVLEERKVKFYYDEEEKSTTVTATYKFHIPYSTLYSENTINKIREYEKSILSMTEFHRAYNGAEYIFFGTKFKTVCADGDTPDQKIGRDRALDKSRRFAYKVVKEIFSIISEDLAKRGEYFNNAILSLDTNIQYINNKEK